MSPSLRTLPSFAAALFALSLSAPVRTHAFTIIATLERDASGLSGPTEYACTFCPNTSTRVSVSFSGGFPPPAIPVAVPANSEISGKAFVDLETGVMSGESHAAAFGHNEWHQIRFVSRLEESITINLPPGTPDDQRFITVIGEVQGDANAVNRGTGNGSYSLQVHNVTAKASLNHRTGWDPSGSQNNSAIEITSLGTGYRFKVRSVIPLSRKVLIETQLEGTAWGEGRVSTGVAIADVHSTATAPLQMILPPGSTYTSTSGVFLTSLPSPEISITKSGDHFILTFGGKLESSPSLAAGSWEPVPDATSPHPLPASASGLRFFRAVNP